MTTIAIPGRPSLETQFERIREYYARRNKDPIEMARLFRDGIAIHGKTQQMFARDIGVAVGTVSNYMSLLKLSDRIKQEISKGSLSFRYAREIARIDAPQVALTRIADYVMKRNLKQEEGYAFIMMARKHPMLAPADIRGLLKTPPQPAQDAEVLEKHRPPVKRRAPVQLSPKALLKIAGLVEMLQPSCEVERLGTVSALRTLQKRVDAKVGELA